MRARGGAMPRPAGVTKTKAPPARFIQDFAVSSGAGVGPSPGTDDGNGDGRGAIGVTSGVVAIGAGLDAALAVALGADLAFAGFAFLAGFALAFGLALVLALRTAFFADFRIVFFAAVLVFFLLLLAFALRFFAMFPLPQGSALTRRAIGHWRVCAVPWLNRVR